MLRSLLRSCERNAHLRARRTHFVFSVARFCVASRKHHTGAWPRSHGPTRWGPVPNGRAFCTVQGGNDVFKAIGGSWMGVLKPGEGLQDMRIVWRIGQDGTAMDSPDQNVFGVPSEVGLENSDTVSFNVQNTVKYSGKLVHGEPGKPRRIVGQLTQFGQSYDLELEEIGQEGVPASPVPPERPQTPTPPFPYSNEDVKLPGGADGVSLAGTLSVPDWAHAGGSAAQLVPGVVLVAGSGNHTRDQDVFGHKTLQVLADQLCRAGMAVLRYDKRGVGESTGDITTATTADFVDDAGAAVRWLHAEAGKRGIDPARVGLIGHSEGALVGAMVAPRLPNLAFLGLLSMMSLPSSLLLRRQQRLIAGAHGVDEGSLDILDGVNRDCFAIINNTPDNTEALKQMKEVYDKAKDNAPEELARHLDFNDKVVETSLQTALSPWFRFFLGIDPIDSLKALPHQIPVLAINGSKDLQVPIECLDIVDKALASAGHPRYTTRELKEHNHLFQQLSSGQTGAPQEYSTIPETISPLAVHSITDWLKAEKLLN